jgi:D-arabinose 1-dehydrogenase-like Zn-dependent alcohol dehydrogenase
MLNAQCSMLNAQCSPIEDVIESRNGSRQDARSAIAIMAAGIIGPLISRRFHLEQINEALQLMRSGESHGRLLVIVGD